MSEKLSTERRPRLRIALAAVGLALTGSMAGCASVGAEARPEIAQQVQALEDGDGVNVMPILFYEGEGGVFKGVPTVVYPIAEIKGRGITCDPEKGRRTGQKITSLYVLDDKNVIQLDPEAILSDSKYTIYTPDDGDPNTPPPSPKEALSTVECAQVTVGENGEISQFADVGSVRNAQFGWQLTAKARGWQVWNYPAEGNEGSLLGSQN